MSDVKKLVYDIEAMHELADVWRGSAQELNDVKNNVLGAWARTQLIPNELARLRDWTHQVLERAAGLSDESLAHRNDRAGVALHLDADTVLRMENARAGDVVAATALGTRFGLAAWNFLGWPAKSCVVLPDWANELQQYVSSKAPKAPAAQAVGTPVPAAADGAIAWATQHLNQNFMHGLCLTFVYQAYLSAGIDIGHPPAPPNDTAYQYWVQHASAQQHSPNPPRGALVFWGPTPGHQEGHVAISQGDGTAISTYERSSDFVHNLVISERNATHPYLGWIMPGVSS